MDSIKNGWNNLTERVSGSVSGIFQSKPETALDSLQESTVTQTAGKRRRRRTYKNKKSKSKKNLKKGKKYNTRKRK
tara:strand:+ start:459 stop:686 length:228 start_codon:yes stop_codon:yes gene_type:complete